MSRTTRKLKIFGWIFLLVLLMFAGGTYLYVQRELEPTASGAAFYIRFPKPILLPRAITQLSQRNVIRNPRVARYYAKWKRIPTTVREGTYQLKPGMTVDEVFKALQEPIRKMVRIPETNLSFRTANLLEKEGVLDGKEYKELLKKPADFKDEVDFPLPQKGSLEGYLYPDTYDLPPLLGARETIVRQLKAFESKVWPLIEKAKDPNRVLTIASMVEFEAAKDDERPIIAGVIENRLKKKMPLQIDATVLYALQEWRRVYNVDYRNAPPPYNTYRVNGLPPGPIGSPSAKSVEAALKPAKHDYLYYVAKPTGGYHWFAKDYPGHLANIRKRNQARAAQGQK